MRKSMLTLFAVLSLAFVGSVALATAAGGPGPGTCDGSNCLPNPDCPDADGDGICNGQDPDYVPGTGNPDCPDADGDGICNGQDPDFERHTGGGRWARLVCQLFGPFGF